MQRLEVSGAVRPIYGSLGVIRLIYGSELFYREMGRMVIITSWLLYSRRKSF